MKVFAKDVINKSKKDQPRKRTGAFSYTYTGELLQAMTKNMGPRYERVSAYWTAHGSEAIIFDKKYPMEYVVTVVPRKRPEGATVH